MLNAIIAMLIIGGVCGLILGVAGVKFHVEPDHRQEEIRAMLPGYNCGGCGYAGCDAMAAALAEGTGDIDKCKPSKPEAKAKIKEYLKEHPKPAEAA